MRQHRSTDLGSPGPALTWLLGGGGTPKLTLTQDKLGSKPAAPHTHCAAAQSQHLVSCGAQVLQNLQPQREKGWAENDMH